MKSKSVRNSVVAGLLAVAAAGYSLQAVAVPVAPLANEAYSFHQHAGFVVDPGFLVSTAGPNGPVPSNRIRWYEDATTGETTPPSPFTGDPTFDTIAWGYQNGSAASGLIATNPFTTGTNSDNRYSGLRVTGLRNNMVLANPATPANPSNLLKTGADLGDGTTAFGDYASVTRIFHRNQAINAFARTLTDAVIFSALTFDHADVGDLYTSLGGIAFKFRETPNSGSCPLGKPNGTICDDLFRFSNEGFAPVTFNYGDHILQVEFALGNFFKSSTNFPACPGSPDGVGYECTVWTAENVTSSLDVLARIREIGQVHHEVPEPTTLALLGLSLLGVAGLRRRRTAVAEA